MLSISTWY